MALIGAAFGIGFTFGPVVGGFGHQLSPAAPGFFAAGFSLIALTFAWRRLAEPERHGAHRARTWLDTSALRQAMRTRGVAAILLMAFLSVCCFAMLESTLGLLGKRRYEFEILKVTLLYSYFGLWSAVSQGMIVRWLLHRVGERVLVVAGPIMLALGLAGLALAGSFEVLLLVAPVPVIGFGMIMPSLSSLLSRRTDPTGQGGVLGLSQSLQSLARIVGPFVGLTLLEVSTSRPFMIGAVSMAIPLLLGISLAASKSEDRY
jgi:DHA1 family tetracycline resistance protein-like MFS transporter